jgi:phage terminase small subunit
MPNEVKEKVLSEIAAGATPQQCADKYSISAGTIRSWVSRCKNNKCNVAKKPEKKPATQRKNVAAEKKATVKSKVAKPAESTDEELTEKQRLFCEIYIRNFNATTAAIRAGYSEKTAYSIGHELLKKPEIRKEIDRLKELKRQALMISEDDIVERYMKIAFADISDFVEFGRVLTPVMNMFGPVEALNPETGKKEPLMREVNDVRFKDFTQVDGGLICQIKQGKDGASLKLEDRQKALDWLANFFNMNPASKHRQQYDNERLKIERERLEIERSKTGDTGNGEAPNDGFIDALNASAKEAWADAPESS